MAVDFDVEGEVAIITINRPEARNAVDRETSLAVSAAIKRIESDPTLRVAVLTGAGGHFSAGMDLKAFLRGEVIRLPELGFAGITQAKLTKPYIAAVEGYALGGGFEMALACDLVVAAESAKFGLSEVKRGLVANAGGLVRLPRQLPIKIAAEIVLTGETFPASVLAGHGLVNRVVPQGQALDAARQLARTIAANGPMAISISRRVLNESADWSSEELFPRQFELTAPVFTSEDAREGAAAFTERRTPNWKGR
jgi:enoyl-CoA hydratase